MADLPDYYTQTAISEAEAAGIKGGLDANKSAAPVSRNIYLATDTHILYVCFSDGVWEGFDAAMLTQGILTLYANMIGGGFRITGLGDPTADQDAATRAYVLAQKALCLLLTGGTMSGDIAMGTNKLTGLGAPAAQNDSLRYGQAEIRNAEIAAAAAIAYTKLALTGAIKKGDIEAAAGIEYSKLALTGAIKKGDIEAAAGIEYSKLALAASIVMADLAAAIQNAANGIVVLDASADVPDAQIPNLAAGKITSDRFPVDRLPAMTDEKIWKGTGANVEEVDMPTKTPTASGTYTGNSTANRAIPHGLGVTPKVVFISGDDTYNHRIICAYAFIHYWSSAAADKIAVTIPDATNFYVGNAAEYRHSANHNQPYTYYWVAIG